MESIASKEEVVEQKTEFLEIEVKFRADGIDRMQFKELAKSLNPKEFLYVESTDTYYEHSLNDFLRYRAPAESSKDKRAELTFKKKHNDTHNVVRTEVNLRVDQNKIDVIKEFCEGLGYVFNFEIWKACDIYKYEDATLVYYTVKDGDGTLKNYMEIEVKEGYPKTIDEGRAIILKYEKLIESLGVTYRNRLNKSLYELYRKG